MKKDITCREDIEQLIRAFYAQALEDKKIGFIFTDVAQIGLEAHVPHLVSFWENILLGANSYKRNVMQLHLDLHNKEPLARTHFERWLFLFEQTVDTLFEGDNAHKAKIRAQSIATVIQTKIYQKKHLI